MTPEQIAQLILVIDMAEAAAAKAWELLKRHNSGDKITAEEFAAASSATDRELERARKLLGEA